MSNSTQWARAAQVDDGRSVEELIAAYREGAVLARDAFAGMSADELRARPVEGKMSSLEVLGHIADSEQFLADRMKRTVATERPLLVGVDGVAYLEALHYHEREVEPQVRLIALTRELMAADLARLDSDAWAREAVHTETGLVTLRQLLLHSIRHLEGHVATVHEKRAALGLPPTSASTR